MPDEIPTPPAGTEEEQEQVTPEETPAVETPAEEIPQPEEPETPTGEEPEVPEVPAPATPQTPSVEERYRNSSSEAMILNSQKKNLEATLNQITSEDTPTEAELLSEYPEYKEYNTVTQKLMRETLANKKRQMRINRQLIEQEAERKWEADLRGITRRPEYASLAGDAKFEDFVLKPQHRGVDIQTLADAYLVRSGKITPPIEPTEPKPAPQPRNSGLPRGAGGPRTAPTKAKLSYEQGKALRETNYKEWFRLVKAGQIEEDI